MPTSPQSSHLFCVLLCLAVSGCVNPRLESDVSHEAPVETPEYADLQRVVESGLRPTFYPAGSPVPRGSIAERMEHYGVPGVSVAVLKGGDVDWAQGYGVLVAGTTDSVTTETRFQAASISKPVSAVTALRLVDSGVLDLDHDVNDRLTSWQLPTTTQPSRSVGLRALLSHTAGVNVSGFPGYAETDSVPSLVDVLSGRGNTDAVRQDTVAGAVFRYSGGGYAVAQLLVEDATGDPFSDVAQRETLSPLGMNHSTFAQPLPEASAPTAAVGHLEDGVPVPGRWRTYPELTAAGLWSTPSDLARFASAVRDASRGEGDGFLSVGTATVALTPVLATYGLGFINRGEGAERLIWHSGANEGYRASMFVHEPSGDGVVVMTNSDAGLPLVEEVVRSVASAYGWPFPEPEARETVALRASDLDVLTGRYRLDEEPETVVEVTREGDRLRVRVPGFWEAGRLLWASSPTSFFDMATGSRVTFDQERGQTVLRLLGAYTGRPVDEL